MAEPFIFINTYPIREGKLEDYKNASKKVFDLVEANEPDMAHFAFYVSEDGTEVTTLQVHRNAENMAFHMDLVASQIEDAREYLDFSKMSIEIYGTPTEALIEQMRQIAGAGVPVTIKGPLATFTRLG